MSTTEPRHSTTLRMMAGTSHPRLSDALARFEDSFGAGLVWVVSMPARLCAAADHTDYWQCFSPELVTFASAEHRMWAIIKPRDDSVVRMQSTHPSFTDREFDISQDIPERMEGMSWLEWLERKGAPEPDWANYVLGSIRHTQFSSPETLLKGFDMLVDSTIPSSSGASSSSALAMCGMMAFRLSNRLPTNALEMARDTADAEWYVGTRGGMMDHATMAFAQAEHALRLTFRPFSATPIPLSLPGTRFVTIFTHPSDKGGGTLRSFNELAFVARELLPRLLADEGWPLTGEPMEDWEGTAERLPVELTVNEVRDRWPDDFDEMRARYPVLLASENLSMRIADRFRFGMREFQRSRELQALMESDALTPEALGGIFDAAWEDAGELYGIRTPEMDRIASIARDVDGVLGLKVMGAGFGGNLLAVIHEEAVNQLIDALGSNGDGVLVCSAGGGMDVLEVEDLAPAADEQEAGLAVVLLCGGAGRRMQAGGVTTHKPLLEVNGVPSTRFVLESLLDSGLDFAQFLVVVPPARVSEYETALSDLSAEIITQDEPLGTGNAVFAALDHLTAEVEHVWVTFGSQPLIRAASVRAALGHHLANQLDFTLPTTWRDEPYAPLLRDDERRVTDSVETHLDGFEAPEFGETNIGGYWASRMALESVLRELHTELFDEEAGRYRTPSGELGYPNEMVRGCLAAGQGVDGVPCADPEEVVGIKTPAHLEDINKRLEARRRWN